MERNTYIDDFAPSATHYSDIITIFEVTSLMNTVHLPMYKWATNSTHLQEIWRTKFLPLQTETQVQGMDWETQSDRIHIDHSDITLALPERPAIKHQLQQVPSRFYDPLGLFSPVTLVGKIIFQITWTRELSWDDLLPPDIVVKWLSWSSQLHLLSEMHVPRWIGAHKHKLQDPSMSDSSVASPA